MTGLMKADSCRSVRLFSDKSRGDWFGAAVSPAPSPEALRIAELETEVAQMRMTASADRAAAERALVKARADGKREAQDETSRNDQKRLTILSEGITGARDALDSRIADLDGLAALVARSALAKLFDGCDSHRDIVIGMIARQMRNLRRDTVLTIRVSQHDFPDEVSLATVGAGAATGGISVVRDDDFESGQCRIDLQLGHIDLCSRSQWMELADLLHELSGTEAAA